MVLLVRDKVPYLGLKSLKLIKTNEELRYDYGDKCMLSWRKQKNLCVPLHLKDIKNQGNQKLQQSSKVLKLIAPVNMASVSCGNVGKRNSADDLSQPPRKLKKISHASILKLKEGQKTVIEVEVLKEPYMIIRDRENLFKPLIYKTKIPNLHFNQ
ncbi:uncharacterized protein LOC130656430 isoform X1 [Hydractinia symbiolongicarpus]|uniref:uncharacterized protein LOC130656430 isoform X1 n=1 Tax=Hydractinia symbiolongicarpus TaxID=13093 RepID=UPI00254D53B2|nr:uncharacterized protein LOC130656430 isoform X1 [Hydractinia symbiolongicarpus]XP_057315261.1 uncharacterized protein LOC130656430 isoform X1 [Hydractinia symbiolongicarpus]